METKTKNKMKEISKIRVNPLSEREMTERDLRLCQAVIQVRQKAGSYANAMFVQAESRLQHQLNFNL